MKWNGPYTGTLFGSVGTDGFCNLWLESQTSDIQSGHRYKQIHRIPTKSSRPWQSLDFKSHGLETYLALTSFDGSLSIFEPRDHGDLTDDWLEWSPSSDFHVLEPVPPPSVETGFHVAWCPERVPCFTAVEAGLDKKSMGLVVAAMELARVFRTDKERRLYLAAELTGAQDIVRSVAWSRGSMRGFDVLAAGSKDGIVRLYELHTPHHKRPARTSIDNGVGTPAQQRLKVARSGIGAGLAEMSRAAQPVAEAEEYAHDPSHVVHEVRLVAELRGHLGAVWHVNFSFTGEFLMSTGDDGSVRTWKRDLDGVWNEYAEIEIETMEQEHENGGEEDEDEDEGFDF